MEKLTFEFKCDTPGAAPAGTSAVNGVVSSGNLEVLLERQDLSGACRFEISTAAEGFSEVWEAVGSDFVERNSAADLLISINDYAASPDVVSLRLDQALEMLKGGAK